MIRNSKFFESKRIDTLEHYRTGISNNANNQTPALFYPGAGHDYGPMWYFNKHYGIKRFIHVDYLLNYIRPPEKNSRSYTTTEQDIAKETLLNFQDSSYNTINSFLLLLENFPDYTIESIKEIFPSYFGVYNWDCFWDSECPKSYHCPSYGIKIVLSNKADTIEFFFLKTDAIGTYNLLLALDWNIQVMVVQDHGFGCLWTSFAGKSRLYQIARLYNKFPNYLFVAEGHEIWPGYKQTHDAILIKRGQAHDFYRAVCEYSPKYKTSRRVVKELGASQASKENLPSHSWR